MCIRDRLNTIYSLCQKHLAADLGELLAKQTDYEARLQAITHGDEAIAAVAAELNVTEEKMCIRDRPVGVRAGAGVSCTTKRASGMPSRARVV